MHISLSHISKENIHIARDVYFQDKKEASKYITYMFHSVNAFKFQNISNFLQEKISVQVYIDMYLNFRDV